MTSPVPKITERGFQHHEPVPSEYGGDVRVYESSAASGPHIWLSTKSLVDMNDPSGPMKEATVHLALENATLLRDQLTQLIDNHYQVRDSRAGNTHRAVIETSVPPSMLLVAAGPLGFCTTALAEWIVKHPLGEYETPLLLAVASEGESTRA